MANTTERELIEGRPVLLVVDYQRGGLEPSEDAAIPHMDGYPEQLELARVLIDKARDCGVPVVFFQEVHRPDMVDFGRELDGAEGVHCLEGDPRTEIAEQVGMRPDDYLIRKRRYSCFFGTELEILLKGLQADTLLLIGGLTDVCIHYTFVDGHQHDYFCRVVEDCVTGSDDQAHEAALVAMEYLQAGARRTMTEVMAGFEAYASTAGAGAAPR